MLDFDRFAQIKRIGGEPAALRQLLAAKDKGAQPREIVDIAKEIELTKRPRPKNAAKKRVRSTATVNAAPCSA
jgi:hypothetical protein